MRDRPPPGAPRRRTRPIGWCDGAGYAYSPTARPSRPARSGAANRRPTPRASSQSDDVLTPPGDDKALRANALRNLGEVDNQSDYRRAVRDAGPRPASRPAHRPWARSRWRTHDDELRSTCLHSLGEVLHQLKLPNEAYRVWYRLAHKPRDLRNGCDVLRPLPRRADVRPGRPAADSIRISRPRFRSKVTNRCNLKCVMCHCATRCAGR